MGTPLKRRIAFSLTMGLVTTGIISFVLIAFNIGFNGKFAALWLRSWVLAYAMVIPAILMLGPRVQQQVDRLIP